MNINVKQLLLNLYYKIYYMTFNIDLNFIKY